MITILLISDEETGLADLESGLKSCDETEALRANSPQKALDLITGKAIDLAVVDENVLGMSGIELTKKLVSVNPMANYTVVSRLSPKDFHERSEGLGVLMQLPVKPDANDGKTLLGCLRGVLNLTQ